MSYATPADMLNRYDARTIGELLNDVSPGVRVTPTAILTDTKFLAILTSASGMIDAALLAGGQYTPTDLTNLSANSLAYLVQITCEIAMAYTYARRPLYNLEAYRACLELAQTHLEALRKGQNTLGIAANIVASNPTVGGPSTITYDGLGIVRDRVNNFYPGRHVITTSPRS